MYSAKLTGTVTHLSRRIWLDHWMDGGLGQDLGIWLPGMDAFRTLVTCPPPAILAIFHQIRAVADA